MKHLKIYISLLTVMILIMVFFFAAKPSIAKAAGSCPSGPYYGAAAGWGYFDCNQFSGSGGEYVLGAGAITGLDNATTAAGFISTIEADLNSGSAETATGAAFIIDTMEGVPAGTCTQRTVCGAASLSDWEKKVNAYGESGLINFSDQIPWACNQTDTLYDSANNDDISYADTSADASADPCGPGVQVATISFLNPKTRAVIFSIKKDCGNPVGTLDPLAAPDVNISGSIDSKTLPNGTAAPVSSSVTVVLTDTDTGIPQSDTTSSGTYSFSIFSGVNFNIAITSSAPSGSTGGPYTDYQGPASFTSSALAYKCGTAKYQDQVSGNSPSETPGAGCVAGQTIASNNDFDFIYTSGGTITPNTCSSLVASGTSPTFTVVATYTVASGVSYKSVSFNWGDGTTISGGTNSNGKITSAPHTYTSSGLYTVTATISFTSSSATVPNSSCTTTVTVGGGGGGSGPVFTCNTGSYDVTPVVSPDTAYIGADYPASITFNTSGNFESDSNNPYNDNLSQSVNQTSQLTVEATNTDNGLGITSPVTYNLSPGSGSVGPLSLKTTVGLYSVPYQVQIVNVVVDTDPAAHWAPVASPNPTLETPAAPPASSYTSKTTTVAVPVYQTTEVAGNPTTGYYTKEDIKTTYTYTKTTTTPATKSSCADFNIQAGICLVTKPGTPATTTTTVVATDTSDQYYYYITWVSTPNVECPPPVNVQVGYQPYMKVYGGDVMAGSTFDPGLTTSCTPLSGQESNIVGWNYDTPNYSGGGTEYAGYALGAIDGFATNQESGNAGIGLSFASASNNSPSSGEFGGSFVPVSCAPDFFGAKPASAPAPTSSNLSNIASGSYYQNGPFTINGGSVNTGNHVAIYVNGNVYINGNITLSGTWTTIGDIPSFELIVQNGNIYIDNSVTRLDGLYVAQDLNQGGTIYDCSVGEAPASGSEFSGSCSQPLTVNGSFIATQVDLMRTTSPANSTSSTNTLFDSTGDTSTSNHASEVFNYSPAVWLGLTNNSLLGTNSNNTILNNYNSITSLPPVL